MANRRPLYVGSDGVIYRFDPTLDVLEAQIEAANVIGFEEAVDDRVASLIKPSATVRWAYEDASDSLYAFVQEGSLTDDHIASGANISWSKINKTGSNLVEITTRYHNDLQDIQGGNATERYHLDASEHSALTEGLDASDYHHHDSRYYTQVQLVSPGQAQVHWDNIISRPSTFPPSDHTHTSDDVTDFDQAARQAVADALTDSDSVELVYASDKFYANVRVQATDTVKLGVDSSGLRADLNYTDGETVALVATSDGLQAEVREGSLTNAHISDGAAIAWSKIDKYGSRLEDLGNVVVEDGKGIVFDQSTDTWLAVDLLTVAHRDASVLDHPDGSVTEAKLADEAVTERTIAYNVDVSSKGFNADMVDGKHVNDDASDDSSLWTAQKIVAYVQSCVSGTTSFQDPVIDRDLCTPPSSPNVGDRYLVCPSGATDAWAGHENEIAEWDGSSWVFQTPSEGWVVWVNDENTYYIFDGSQWKTWAANIDHEALQNLQGGSGGEHYHLTASQHTQLTAGQSADGLHFHTVLKDPSGNVRLEATSSGLDAKGLRVTAVGDPTDDQDAVNRRTLANWQHNDLQGIQGGADGEYYHLTLEQLEAVTASADAVRVFDNLNVVGGSYLKTGYPMFADKDFVEVYQDGSLLDPSQWDFYLGQHKLSRLSDVTDTIYLYSPNSSSSYTVRYRERVTPYQPRFGLYREDGQEFTVRRFPVIMDVYGVQYYLAGATFDTNNASVELTYVSMDGSQTRTYTHYVATHARLLDFPAGATLPSPWRLEVWRHKGINPRSGRNETSGVPRYATTVNAVPLTALANNSNPWRGGSYVAVLRDTERNILTLPTPVRLVVQHRRPRTLDGYQGIGWYWQPTLG